MPVCPRCGYHTNEQSNLRNHFERKNPCKPCVSNVPFASLLERYKQGEKFVSLPPHDPDSSWSLQQEVYEMRKEMQEMREMLHKLLTNHSNHGASASGPNSNNTIGNGNTNTNTNTNSNNHTTIQSVVQNITITQPTRNPFGQESLDYITTDFKKQCLVALSDGIQDLVESIHFNPDHPQNHNVMFKSAKNKTFIIWNGTIWREIDDKEAIDLLITKSCQLLFPIYTECRETEDAIKRNDEFIMKWIEALNRHSGESYHTLKKRLKLLVKHKSQTDHASAALPSANN